MSNGTLYYEISYLISPNLSEDEAVSFEGQLRAILGTYEADVESWDSPRRRQLAYPIEGEREAYLGALRFSMDATCAHKLQEKLKSEKSIMRSFFARWVKPPVRIRPPFRAVSPPTPVETQTRTDEKALEDKLEEILGANTP